MTLTNVAKVLLFICMGWGLRHSKSFPESSGKTLSILAAWIFSPAYTVRSLAQDFTVPNISENLLILGAGVVFLLVALAVGFLLSRLMSKDASDDAKTVLMSYLLAIALLPISFGAISHLAGMG